MVSPGQISLSKRSRCAICSNSLDRLPAGPYAYLLGLYLGDGSIATHARGVYRLRIACCNAYPDLMAECMLTVAEVLPNRVGLVRLHRMYGSLGVLQALALSLSSTWRRTEAQETYRSH